MDFTTKSVALQPRPFASENKYPLRITGDLSGIVKRKAGRDNSVGVERGFRARGEMAYWPRAHVYPQRESTRLELSRKKRSGRSFSHAFDTHFSSRQIFHNRKIYTR